MRAFLASVAVTLFLNAQASALECIEVPQNKAFEMSDVVLRGRVTSARYVPMTQSLYSAAPVEVEQLLKGTTPKQIEVFIPVVGGGIDFQNGIGTNYILFLKVLTQESRQTFALPRQVSGFMASQCLSRQGAPAPTDTTKP